MTQLLNNVVLGFVQGATELLPVSSSGHLLIVSDFIHEEPTLFFITFLHLATLLAIIIGYWSNIISIIKDRKNWIRVLGRLIATSIPIVLIGVLFSDQIDSIFYNTTFISINLIFWGIIMIIAESISNKRDKTSTKIHEIPFLSSILIGLGQALALIPGTSRSGITTLSGIATGLSKEDSLDYAFIAGIPVIAGAFFYELLKEGVNTLSTTNIETIAGLSTAFLVGYGFLKLLQYKKDSNFLTFFGIYRIILGMGILVYTIIV